MESSSTTLKGSGTMIYVGIDIAKYTHYAIVIGADGENFLKPLGFEKRQGVLLFLNRLDQWSKEELRCEWNQLRTLENIFYLITGMR